MHKQLAPITAIVLIFLSACSSALNNTPISTLDVLGQTQPIKVIDILDGDTVVIKKLNDGTETKIRLLDIDCPERAQPWGKEATIALKKLLHKKKVTIKATKKDKYERTIGSIFIGDKNINKQLVKDGHCWAGPYNFLEEKSFYFLQKEAKQSKRGLWQLPEDQRIPPWKWRKLHPPTDY